MPAYRGRFGVVATTAGDPGHWAARVREHAIADPLWRLSETSGPPPWIPAELIAEQRRRLPESSYQRLFENVWVSGEDRLVAAEDLSCVTLDGPQDPIPRMSYVISVDPSADPVRTKFLVSSGSSSPHLYGCAWSLSRSRATGVPEAVAIIWHFQLAR